LQHEEEVRLTTNWTPTARRLLDKRLWILGYVTEDFQGDLRSLNSLQQHGSRIDVYADFAFFLHPSGEFTGQVNKLALQEATKQGIAPLILFHNFNGKIFDPVPLRTVLSSTASQQNCIRHMINSLPQNVAGVQVDFEGVEAPYRIPFVQTLFCKLE